MAAFTKRTRSGRVVIIMTLCVALCSLAGVAMSALSLDDALKFARGEMMRLCENKKYSYFNNIDNKKARRSCRVLLFEDSLELVVSFQYSVAQEKKMALQEDSPGRPRQITRSGTRSVEVDYHRDSEFLCGPERENGFAPLYLNCLEESAISDEQCVTERREMWTGQGQRQVAQRKRSFVLLFSTPPAHCARLRNALKYIVDRAPIRKKRPVREFFK